MRRSLSRPMWVNLTGSAALVAMIAIVGAAQAGQDQARQGGMVQKGRDMQPAPMPAQAPRPAGPVSDISVSRSPDQTACESGTATACRTIEAGLVTGGAWSFVDGGVTAMDDWESPTAGQAAPPSSSPAERMHRPQVVLTHRVLAACDSGDVSACRAFATSVRPATASERTETRTYTAGR